MAPDSIPPQIGNWVLCDCLGSGFSGSIYRAVNPFTHQSAAIKIQSVDHSCPTNRYERALYPSLQGGKGMPTMWASGVQGKHDYLVLDLLGPSLDNLYRKTGKKVMDLRSVICIAMQVIERLEFMHSRDILHRDIQLGNCVIGLPPNERLIYMIDFGFSKRYIDPTTRRHIPDSKAKRDFIGNYWFTSVNVHCRGKVPSRRDDLEALALMLIHLLTPNGLPWTRNGVPKTEAQQDRLIRAKQRAKPDEICRGLPQEFEDFLRYCRSLKFFERPDYELWRENFAKLARDHGWHNSGTVDEDLYWPPRIERRKVSNSLSGKIADTQEDAPHAPHPGVHPPPAKPTEQPSPAKPIEHPPTKPAEQPPPIKPTEQPPPAKPTDVSGLLDDLANLDLNEHQIPGARKPDHSPGKVIVLSSDDESTPPQPQWSKSVKLRRLTKQASAAADNTALGETVHGFIDVLQANRSRAMTADGFAFLDTLKKQLEDPSVFIINSKGSRPSRTRSQTKALEAAQVQRTPRSNQMLLLRMKLEDAFNNSQLAGLIDEFETLVQRNTGKLVSKDGIIFLEKLEERLKGE
ncbi:kinase-like protein [Rickenella mellea]|uniref:Kinase-like protein n=1 Tax=Rickenella mellea TaxID=50990 RepID=A0A4Y7Q632_9AGAM|nr:kinase-like protein [Rickenella mellea]